MLHLPSPASIETSGVAIRQARVVMIPRNEPAFTMRPSCTCTRSMALAWSFFILVLAALLLLCALAVGTWYVGPCVVWPDTLEQRQFCPIPQLESVQITNEGIQAITAFRNESIFSDDTEHIVYVPQQHATNVKRLTTSAFAIALGYPVCVAVLIDSVTDWCRRRRGATTSRIRLWFRAIHACIYFGMTCLMLMTTTYVWRLPVLIANHMLPVMLYNLASSASSHLVFAATGLVVVTLVAALPPFYYSCDRARSSAASRFHRLDQRPSRSRGTTVHRSGASV